MTKIIAPFPKSGHEIVIPVVRDNGMETFQKGPTLPDQHGVNLPRFRYPKIGSFDGIYGRVCNGMVGSSQGQVRHLAPDCLIAGGGGDGGGW